MGRRPLLACAIALAVFSGKLTQADAGMAQEVSDDDTVKFLLSRKLTFLGGAEFNEIDQTMVEMLKDLTLGFDDYAPDLVLTSKDETEQRAIKTVREYDTAIRQGFFARTGKDMKLQGWFVLPSRVFKALATAKTAEQSYFRPGSGALHDPNTLSAELARVSRDESLEGTIADLLMDKNFLFDASIPYSLAMEQNFGIFIQEIFRADLDNDGLEEMLVSVHRRAIGGTLSWTSTMILGRDSQTALISEKNQDIFLNV